MPDPYATRAPDLSGRPAGPAPWLEAVRERGGAVIEPDGSFPADSAFLAVHCRGIGTLAPFARLHPALAALLWVEHTGQGAIAGAANDLFRRLRDFPGAVYAAKQGSVGGPADRPGCFEVPPELVVELLDAALADRIAWEVDPDFGYDVPAEVPGLDAPASLAVMPRLLYADSDRVYEHASLVAAKKRERAGLLSALDGLEPPVLAASGWPPAPSPSDWRD